MTMQIQDSFSYRGECVDAVAISRRFSFSPTNEFGIATAPSSTANYRGFWCDYSIDESLIIKNVYLFSRDHLYPPINGINAEEIPVLRKSLDSTNEKARIQRKYQDGFPMQYMGIDYDYDYSGRIVLGIGLDQSKKGRERYQKVVELVFDTGIVMETTDITEIWRQVYDRHDKSPTSYWWGQEENDYYHLINYRFMGANEPRDSENNSG